MDSSAKWIVAMKVIIILIITQNTFKANIMDNSSDLWDEVDKFVNCFENNQFNITAEEAAFSDINEQELVISTQEVEEVTAKLPPLGPFSDINDDEEEKASVTRFHFKTDKETIENSHKR